MEKENCQMHRQDSQDFLLSERPHDGFSWFGRRLTRKQTTSRLDDVGPDMWKHMSDAAKKKSKTKIGYPETKTRKRQTLERNILH